MATLKAQMEIGVDASGVEVGISKAKKSINSLGVAVVDSNTKASKSIDKYIRGLEQQAAMHGKSAREVDLYKLALRGASDAQLKAADSALKLKESFEKADERSARTRANFVAFGAIAAGAVIAAAVAFDQLLGKASQFADLSDKYGDTAENFASLALVAGTTGVALDTIGSAAGMLTKNLTGVDDESKAAGAALKALGLDLETFKKLSPVDQLEATAKALDGFRDGSEKTAVAMALFGKSGADLLPLLKELAKEGSRQVILTQEQINLADEYGDRQAKLRTEIGLYAQAYATQLLPALNSFAETIAGVVKDQQFAAVGMDILKGAIAGATVVFQTIAVVASDVAFVFQGVGREIGAITAQLAALARGDITGFRAISDAVREDADRARKELDRFQARIMGVGLGVAPKFADPRILGSTGSIAEQAAAFGSQKPKLNFSGAIKAEKGKADEEAKAQLAFDLEQIKRANEAITGAFANAEKIMEAKRSAGLLDEREYYAAKLGFLRLNEAAQTNALNQEIARLEQEKLSGKDALDRDRKILELRAKIAKAQADATTSLIVLETQEEAAIKAKTSALLSARQAAQDYYADIQRQQARELAGIGQGSRRRDLDAGLAQIDDKYRQQRSDLENQRALLELEGKFTEESRKQFEARLAIIEEFQKKSSDSYIAYYADLSAKQQDWALGANEALQNYYDQSLNVFEGVEQAVTNAFKGMEDALVSFVTTGKLDFRGLADSIIADISRIIIKQQITGPLAQALQGGGSGGGIFGSLFGGLFGKGGASTGFGTGSAFGNLDFGGFFAKGIDYVPKDMLAVIHEGERIVPAAENRRNGGMGGPVTVNVMVPSRTERQTRQQVASDTAMALRRAERFA